MKQVLFTLLIFLVAGCSTQRVEDYAATNPSLDLRTFLNGELRAYGMLQNRSGKMTRRFTAELQGSWSGERGVLEEKFEFDDGEIQYRTWQLQHDGNGHYSGTAGDVFGTAAGDARGSVFNWQYALEVPYSDDTITVNLDDWLYLVDERHLLNRTTLTKFGFRVGELTLLIEKLPLE
jgi:hypothetical protein